MSIARQWKGTGPEGQEDMPWLMGVGPVTTARAVKAQMMADFDPHDPMFMTLLERCRAGLMTLAGAGPDHVCLMIDGPELTAVEAAVATFAPESRRRKTLIASNGADGEQIARILDLLRRPFSLMTRDERSPFVAGEIDKVLVDDADVALVAISHCQSSSGLINPVWDIAPAVRTRGRIMMVNAVNSLGALPINMTASGIDVLIAVPGRLVESVPGLSFVICRRDLLDAARGVSHSLTLDLVARYDALAAGDAERYRLPAHAVAALAQALRDLDSEGGPMARLARYERVGRRLSEGMQSLGFEPLLPADAGMPAIQTFLLADDGVDFPAFEAGLRQRGFVIAPGQLSRRASFRVGIAGRIGERTVDRFLAAAGEVLRQAQN